MTCSVPHSLATVPSPPLNLTVTRIEDKEIGLRWARPSEPNGDINGYRLYYMRGNFTSVRTVNGDHGYMEYSLGDMGEYFCNIVLLL